MANNQTLDTKKFWFPIVGKDWDLQMEISLLKKHSLSDHLTVETGGHPFGNSKANEFQIVEDP